MTDFSANFMQYVPPDQEAIESAITRGIVVLDSNVLLSAYRFAPKSRSELLDVLELVGDRLWIPYQVALEFHRNRLKVIADYDAAYKEAVDVLTARRKEFIPELGQKIRELSNRVALPDGERDELLRLLDTSLDNISSSLEKLRDAHGVGNPGSPDPILKHLRKLLAGKVGPPLTPDDEKEELAEAARRIEKALPPGYKDSDKDEPHGDYFVWCQALREARTRNVGSLVLVTNDTKEDWYLRLKGQTIMARPELSLECSERSGARLLLLPTRLFLTYAKRFLEAEVSDETIRQAESTQIADDRRYHHAESITNQLLALEREEIRLKMRLRVLSSANRAAREEEQHATAAMRRAEDEYSEMLRRTYGDDAPGPDGMAVAHDAQVRLEAAEHNVAAVRRKLGELDNDVQVAEAELDDVRRLTNAAQASLDVASLSNTDKRRLGYSTSFAAGRRVP